ncbi:TrkA family potassium uptake protein [bacterium]|nr:MAG: TrkA family potassium uptake protein [bacterium]
MKKFGIIGLGKFGATAARELAGLGCKVTVVDRNENRARQLADEVDTALVADARHKEQLENMDVAGFDTWLVAIGRDPHASILVTLHLKELGATSIVAKANSRDHARILEKVGATQVVIPEEQMAVRMAHSLARSDLVDFLPLTGDYLISEVKPAAQFVGKRLLDIDLRDEREVQIVAIRHGEGGLTPAPSAGHVVAEDEVWIVLGREGDIEELRRL